MVMMEDRNILTISLFLYINLIRVRVLDFSLGLRFSVRQREIELEREREDEADLDEGPWAAADVPQVQQGGRSPLLLRQGPHSYRLVRWQWRAPWHLSWPQRRRMVLRCLPYLPLIFLIYSFSCLFSIFF